MKKRLLLLAALALLLTVFLPAATAETSITSVAVLNIAAPLPGQQPVYSATISDSRYSVESLTTSQWVGGIYWRDITESTYLTSTQTFVAGHTYRVMVSLVPASGYVFASDGSGGAKVSAFLNGMTASQVVYWNSTNIGVAMDFVCPTPVSKIYVNGVTAPQAGSKPSYAAPQCSDEHTFVDTTAWTSGIKWRDVTAQKDLTASDTFIAGHTYEYAVMLKAQSGYTFCGAGNCYINNQQATSYGRSADWQYIYPCYVFSCPLLITHPEVTVTTPRGGAAAPFFAAVPADRGYAVENFNLSNYHNGIRWYDTTDKAYLSPGEYFTAGHRYELSISLIAQEGYGFPSAAASVTGKINGAAVSGVSIWDTSNIGLTAYFIAARTVTGVAIVGIDAPVPGKTPDYSAAISDVGVDFGIQNDTYYVNGIIWADITAEKYMTPSDVFQTGHEYGVKITLTTMEGYVFPTYSGDLEVTISGKAIDEARGYTDTGVDACRYYSLAHTGWYKDGDDWYYYDAKCQAVTGWQKISGAWYYFNSDGVMQLGWQKIGDAYYNLGSNGAMRTGWQKIGDQWYYFNTDGRMQIGWKQIGGKWYCFYADGAMLTGWQKIGGVYYYFNASGAMQTGWQKIGGKYYYFNSSGAMVTGWQKIGGVYYYFNASGAMVTGWQKIGGVYYYFNASGAIQTGWQKIGGKYYYFSASGAMQTGWQKIGGYWYHFDASGAMQTGWLKDGGNWYYLDGSGRMVVSQTLTIGGKSYTFNAAGVCTNP